MTVLTSKIIRILLGVLLAVSTLLAILFYLDAISDDGLIFWGYFLLGLATLITILFPLAFLLMNPKNSIKIFIAIGLMVVLGIVAFSLSEVGFTDLQIEKLETSAETSRYVGAGLIFTYILGSFAFLTIIYAGISKLFKQ